MSTYTAHIDTFTREHLPPRESWPEFRFDLPELQYPERVNCGRVHLDDALAEGHSERVALYSDAGHWTYAELACTWRNTKSGSNRHLKQAATMKMPRIVIKSDRFSANVPTILSWCSTF